MACISSTGETFESVFLQLSTDHQNGLLAVAFDRDCPAIERVRKLAARLNLNFEILQFDKGKSFESSFCEFIKSKKLLSSPVCFLCGFFGILSENFFSDFPGPVVNTHPSLLPAFPGMEKKVQMSAWEQAALSGVTVHMVNEELDAGPILFQYPISIEPGVSFEDFRADLRQWEQSRVPIALAKVLESSLSKDDVHLKSQEIRKKYKFKSEF